MFIEGFGVDGDIVDIDMEDFSYEVTKDFVHGALKGGRGITESKGHPGVHIVTKGSDEGGDRSGALSEASLVESSIEVQRGKVLGVALHLLEDLLGSRKGIGVHDCEVVDMVESHTESWCGFSINSLLGGNDYGRGP